MENVAGILKNYTSWLLYVELYILQCAFKFKGTVHLREKLYYWTDLFENLIQAVKGKKNSFCSWHFFDKTGIFFF